MTNKEIVEMLQLLLDNAKVGCADITAIHHVSFDSFKFVIENTTKALEQKPKSEWEHDHEILKAYSDGANEMLDKIRAEIEQAEISDYIRDAECFRAGLNRALNIIDKYKTESDNP